MPLFARLNSWMDRLTPARRMTPREGFQVRVLIRGTLLGLVMAVVSVTSALVFYSPGPAITVGTFGIGCFALLAATRAGASMVALRRAALLLVGGFLVAECLQTADLDWAALKWLVLLPMLSLFLDGTSLEPRARRRPLGALWSGAALAIVLAVVIAFANSRGWTAGAPDPDTRVGGIALGPLIDFTLFTLSVAGLVTIHSHAQRLMEEELRLLRSMLSICAWCRRIRDDEDGWMELEHYMTKRTSSLLTHGICPECAARALAE